MRCTARVVGALVLTGVAGCALLTSLDDLCATCGEAGSDAAIEAPATGCVITISPARAVLDPGDHSKAVDVVLARGSDVLGPAIVVVNGLPSDVSQSTLTLGADATTGSFTVGVPGTASLGTFDASVLATIGNVTCDAPWQLVVGSAVGAFADSGTFTVPAGESTLIVDVWGAGGGSTSQGRPGGGGGFAEATFSVTPLESLQIVVGAGGEPGSSNNNNTSGGGGGGYSAVEREGGVLLLAGAGGGASRYIGGGGGGGISGGGTTGASGGTQANGGSGGNSGGAFAGGAGSCNDPNGCTNGAPGGKPGGGAGGQALDPTSYSGSGGGGAGWYGGGGGAGTSGGGGGSGYASDAGLSVTLLGADGSAPPATDRVGYVAGVASGGDAGSRGGGGRVVFMIPKWIP